MDCEPKQHGETSKPKQKSEWTIGKILIRLLVYPFCAVIIYFSIMGLIPEGKLMHGIAAIGIALAYLISDLFLIFKKKS